jgi:sodium-dependent dicarboxylate transporter 2/3/5
MAPLAILMLIAVAAVLSYGTDNTRLKLDQEKTSLDIDQKKLLVILGLVMIFLLLNAPLGPWPGLGWDENLILLGGGLSVFLPRQNLLTWEHNKKIPYEIIFLFGAGFSLAAAFTSTGLAAAVASGLTSWQNLPFIILLVLIATLVTFATEVTSNTALVSVMLPVIYAVATALGLNAILLLTVCTICASYAFMLPIATPPNAIALSSGQVQTRDMARFGMILNLIGIILISLIAVSVWQLVL